VKNKTLVAMLFMDGSRVEIGSSFDDVEPMNKYMARLYISRNPSTPLATVSRGSENFETLTGTHQHSLEAFRITQNTTHKYHQ